MKTRASLHALGNVSLCFCIFSVFLCEVSVPSVLNLYRTPNQTLQHRVHRGLTDSPESGAAEPAPARLLARCDTMKG